MSDYKGSGHTMCKFCVSLSFMFIKTILCVLSKVHSVLRNPTFLHKLQLGSFRVCRSSQSQCLVSTVHIIFCFQGIGKACPINIDSANNDLTGRVIRSNQMKELIIQLHNEVRWRLFDHPDIHTQTVCLAFDNQTIVPIVK